MCIIGFQSAEIPGNHDFEDIKVAGHLEAAHEVSGVDLKNKYELDYCTKIAPKLTSREFAETE